MFVFNKLFAFANIQAAAFLRLRRSQDPPARSTVTKRVSRRACRFRERASKNAAEKSEHLRIGKRRGIPKISGLRIADRRFLTRRCFEILQIENGF